MFKMKKYIKNNSGVISFLICLGICALCVIIFSLIAAIIISFESPFEEISSMIFVLPSINPTIRTMNIVITILKNPEKSKVILQNII